MQTQIIDAIKATPEGQDADAILRKCVHCGFCLATCPTYSLSGNELQSPRGRIYLIKQMLESGQAPESTRQHLDSCLNCRACETTCPASVPYHRLLDIGTQLLEEQRPRRWRERLLRRAVLTVLPYPSRFTPLLRTAQIVRPLLPGSLKNKLPRHQPASAAPRKTGVRKMLLLEGCVQPGIAPEINAATRRVLSHFDISLQSARNAGCCGAISYHLQQKDDGLNFMRRNIDAWWPLVEKGFEAIVITASGCGTTIKEYGSLLKDDSQYADKAAQISYLAKDLVEILREEPLEQLKVETQGSLAFQCPCSLQHAQKLGGTVEQLLARMGFKMMPISESYLCCGSAGTYSLFQPELATELRNRKSAALRNSSADHYISANIGCISHLSSSTDKPVEHWIQIIDRALQISD
ncbi:glycolate oxidase subunit GlcF [Pontibacterium granulatum]|uniref:glycolate oxidase subunit GlcF n=1 Tax=Pontibacterium granulatum TaxID=2036029 RepID=UPI00249B9C92|nr:glycolate oxidase subunit GlcF [Pontibacterium granulatum]MDI3325675.1 glycolate oxidase subunit GlcF [Pontibacterium granulatum]